MINYVEGVWNVVTDVLSHMYTGQKDSILIDDWVNADIHLDPDGKTLLLAQLPKLHVMHFVPLWANGALLKK
jgi:hypothetical protein